MVVSTRAFGYMDQKYLRVVVLATKNGVERSMALDKMEPRENSPRAMRHRRHSWWRFSLIILVCLSGESAVLAQAIPINAPDEHWVDLDGYFGIGRLVGPGTPGWKARWSEAWSMMGRVRVGYSVLKPYWILTVGATYGIKSRALADQSVGFQVELLHLTSGLSLYGGPEFTLDGRAGFLMGVGVSIVGVELELLPARSGPFAKSKLDHGLFVVLRIPISLGIYSTMEFFRFRRRIQAAIRRARHMNR